MKRLLSISMLITVSHATVQTSQPATIHHPCVLYTRYHTSGWKAGGRGLSEKHFAGLSCGNNVGILHYYYCSIGSRGKADLTPSFLWPDADREV
ncbi:hypothetical protein GO009_06800 [Muricauda sp. TY007]|uniref:hypothetical protein n=1 Tax=Allomuricauda sp. TY007 TaxID=2683200 RepID=UPI0013BF7E90|nr:hypothetical protein [Muricauda sp. TY007]NDV15731.1 hypothetical protein [Muricauda sp. TY007]